MPVPSPQRERASRGAMSPRCAARTPASVHHTHGRSQTALLTDGEQGWAKGLRLSLQLSYPGSVSRGTSRLRLQSGGFMIHIHTCVCVCVCILCVCIWIYMRSVQKKSSHCQYNENGSHDIDVTWQPRSVDWNVHM